MLGHSAAVRIDYRQTLFAEHLVGRYESCPGLAVRSQRRSVFWFDHVQPLKARHDAPPLSLSLTRQPRRRIRRRPLERRRQRNWPAGAILAIAAAVQQQQCGWLSCRHQPTRRSCAGSWAPFRTLQSRCASCTFALTCAPPSESGSMWSKLALRLCGYFNRLSTRLPQIPHFQPSRSNISISLNFSTAVPILNALRLRHRSCLAGLLLRCSSQYLTLAQRDLWELPVNQFATDFAIPGRQRTCVRDPPSLVTTLRRTESARPAGEFASTMAASVSVTSIGAVLLVPIGKEVHAAGQTLSVHIEPVLLTAPWLWSYAGILQLGTTDRTRCHLRSCPTAALVMHVAKELRAHLLVTVGDAARREFLQLTATRVASRFTRRKHRMHRHLTARAGHNWTVGMAWSFIVLHGSPGECEQPHTREDMGLL